MKPVVIEVFGDKHTKPEPEQHRISFPGGEISVERTSDGEYWAHIHVNTHYSEEPNLTHVTSKRGKIVHSRVDFDFPEYERRGTHGLKTIPEIPNAEDAKHIAVRIAIADVEKPKLRGLGLTNPDGSPLKGRQWG